MVCLSVMCVVLLWLVWRRVRVQWQMMRVRRLSIGSVCLKVVIVLLVWLVLRVSAFCKVRVGVQFGLTVTVVVMVRVVLALCCTVRRTLVSSMRVVGL